MHRTRMKSPQSEMWEEFLEPPYVESCDHGVSFLAHCTECRREREMRA